MPFFFLWDILGGFGRLGVYSCGDCRAYLRGFVAAGLPRLDCMRLFFSTWDITSGHIRLVLSLCPILT